MGISFGVRGMGKTVTTTFLESRTQGPDIPEPSLLSEVNVKVTVEGVVLFNSVDEGV